MLQVTNKKEGVPSFLLKTYEMLESDEYRQLINWSSSGQAFVVYNQQELAQQVLPNYFKHRNYPSFLRQLNMYNFKKTKNEFGFSEFRHKWFRRGLRSLLKYIKRRNQEQQVENLDIDVKESDVENCKSEHQEMSTTLSNILKNQQKMQQEFNIALSQSTQFAKEAQNLVQQLRQMETVTSKKFDKLSIIVSNLVSGIENHDIQSKLNLLFTQALLGEDSPSYSEMNSQGDPNNCTIVQQNRNDNNFLPRQNDLLPYSGGNSPYRNFEIPSPFYNMMCQQIQQNGTQFQPSKAFSNVLFDQNLYHQLNQLHQMQMASQAQQLALPPSIPMPFVCMMPQLQSQRPSEMPSPYREESQGNNYK